MKKLTNSIYHEDGKFKLKQPSANKKSVNEIKDGVVHLKEIVYEDIHRTIKEYMEVLNLLNNEITKDSDVKDIDAAIDIAKYIYTSNISFMDQLCLSKESSRLENFSNIILHDCYKCADNAVYVKDNLLIKKKENQRKSYKIESKKKSYKVKTTDNIKNPSEKECLIKRKLPLYPNINASVFDKKFYKEAINKYINQHSTDGKLNDSAIIVSSDSLLGKTEVVGKVLFINDDLCSVVVKYERNRVAKNDYISFMYHETSNSDTSLIKIKEIDKFILCSE